MLCISCHFIYWLLLPFQEYDEHKSCEKKKDKITLYDCLDLFASEEEEKNWS